ncbi:MAG: ABC transporter permease, partial [Clostridiales bacterium]|nr:ABC transporter permease [Clostridiales bacterium]
MENIPQNSKLRPTSNNKVKHRIPGMRRWKKNRGQFWLILVFMTLCFLLMEITFLFSDSMGYTLQEHRLDAYGEWQYAVENISETEEENIRSLSLLEDAGAIWVAGDIVSKEIADTTCLGGMDAEALRLGRISLLEGHFPENGGEAVIEASILEKMDGQLGDEYTFEIELPPTHSHPSIETYSITVTVCGVIKDYSAGWCISDLPGVLVTEETAEPENRSLPHKEISDPEDSRKQYTLLVKGTTNTENLRRSIQSMDLENGWLSGNEYAYPEMAEGVDRLQNILHILLLFILGVNTLILYVVIRYSVRSRRQEWRDLYVLGATVRRLRGLLVREGLFFCLIAMVSGFLLAVLAFFTISAILPNLLDLQLHFVFSFKNTVWALVLGSVSVILAYLIPILGIRRLATGTPIQEKKRMVRRRTKQKRKAVGWSAIWIRSWGERPLGAVAQMLLLCAILLLPCIGVEMIWETAQEVPGYYDRQGGTYVWDSHNDTFSKTKVEKLESIYGVEDVRAWHRYFSYPQEQTEGYEVVIDLQNYQNDAYIQMVLSEQKESQHSITVDIQARIAEIIQSEDDTFLDAYKLDESSSISRESDLENGYYPITLLGTSSENEIQRCLRNLAEGSENEQAFREGDGAILILHPALLKEGNYRKWKINSDEEGEYLITQGIDVGSVLRVRVDGSWMEIPVSGIIYDFDGMDGEAPFSYNPISLVCSDGLFES